MREEHNESVNPEPKEICSNCVHYERGLCNAFFEERDPEEEPLMAKCFEID